MELVQLETTYLPAFALDRPEIVHEAVIEVLAGLFPTVSAHMLLSSDRLGQTTAWVRQVAMYLMVRRAGVSMLTTARLFGRDRTTVRHALALIDDIAAMRPATASLIDFLDLEMRAALDRLAQNERGQA